MFECSFNVPEYKAVPETTSVFLNVNVNLKVIFENIKLFRNVPDIIQLPCS